MTRLAFGISLALAFALTIATSLLPTAASAQRGWDVTLNGGLSLPMGEFGDKDKYDAQSGPQFGLEVCRDVSETIAIGVDGSWMRNKHGAEGSVETLPGGSTLTANKDRFQSLRFGVHGKYKFPMSGPVKVHALLGVGFLDLKEDYEYTLDDGVTKTLFTDENENFKQPGTRWGGKVGLGAMYEASPKIGLGVGVDYNTFVMDEKNLGIKSAPFVGITGRVTYRIMPQ